MHSFKNANEVTGCLDFAALSPSVSSNMLDSVVDFDQSCHGFDHSLIDSVDSASPMKMSTTAGLNMAATKLARQAVLKRPSVS